MLLAVKQHLISMTETCSRFRSFTLKQQAAFYHAIGGEKEILLFCNLGKEGDRGVGREK